ncbi:MAG: SMI1/KNR4 family protein [Christensenellales bacterium]|nr:cell wall assembly/cell proliferation coordinating protein KNR4-like protein [Firmicutes bacterium CAG:555]
MVNIFEPEQSFDEIAFNKICVENGIRFPENYLNFLRQHNDGELESNIISDFDDCSVNYFFGTTLEEYSNFADVLETYRTRMPNLCIPIADAEGGNLLCMSLNKSGYGNILWWDHETMDVDDGEICRYSTSDMLVISKDFDELLRKIIPY